MDWSELEDEDDEPQGKGFTDDNAEWLTPVNKKPKGPYKPASDSEEDKSDEDEQDDGGGDDGSIVTLMIGESSGTEGEMPGEGIQYGVQVPLYYESSASIGGIQFTIYDSPDWVTSTEVVSSENSCFESNSNDVEGSVIRVLFSLEGCELSASDTPVHFATIMYEFSADAGWGETVGLDFSQAIIADGVGNSLSVSTQGSTVNVSISGDISSDSEVNVIDVVNLINYILYIEEPGSIRKEHKYRIN
jgi:hypothetical protein